MSSRSFGFEAISVLAEFVEATFRSVGSAGDARDIVTTALPVEPVVLSTALPVEPVVVRSVRCLFDDSAAFINFFAIAAVSSTG